MTIENDDVTPVADESTTVEPAVTETDGDVTPPVEGTQEDVLSTSNIENLRNAYKTLKTDLDVYKKSHEFISNNFSDTTVAEQARDLFNNFTGSDFDEKQFIEYINTLSPQRTQKLVETLANERATALTDSKVQELFGGKVTPEEIKLFKEFKESGYGLASVDDIPDELKFNEDGTPKSDKEISYLRTLHESVKALKTEREQEREAIEQSKMAQARQELQAKKDEFAFNRLKVIDNEFTKMNLVPTDADTPQQKQDKQFIRDFIINGISSLFLADKTGSEDYNSAMKHIENGEPLLAKRYEPRIESKLLEYMRDDRVQKLLSAFISTPETPESRPEISKQRSAGEPESKSSYTANDIYEELVKKGMIQV